LSLNDLRIHLKHRVCPCPLSGDLWPISMITLMVTYPGAQTSNNSK